jgi:hypothetical protein
MYIPDEYGQFGNDNNQRVLNSLNSPQQSENHDIRNIAETAIWFVIWTYVIEWFAKKAWRHPSAFIITAACVFQVVLISVTVNHFFWPVWIPLVIGFFSLGRMLRR